MSISSRTPREMPTAEASWWRKLGLQGASGVTATGNEMRKRAQIQHYLSECVPTGFIRSTEAGATELLTTEAVIARIAEIERAHTASVVEAAKARVRTGWIRIEAAYAASNARDIVPTGRWSGFTRADATAWCWNLFQFEPHGFTFPGSQVRGGAMRSLEQGELPEVFGYPERARELTDKGMSPRSYRTAQEALGKPTFDQGDVSHG